MSAGFEISEETEAAHAAPNPEEVEAHQAPRTGAEKFASEQLLGLIRRLFLAAWPKPMRQIVFSGVGEDSGSAVLCARVAEALSSQTTARVCLVETEQGIGEVEPGFGGAWADGGNNPEAAGAVRASSLQIRKNLWLVPVRVWRSAEGSATLPWMRRRLGELRSEFDYAVIHAPPVGIGGEAETVARLTDGLVLVLQAHRTRRVLAQVTQQRLRDANVEVLGAVLSDRRFPIPERLYRRF
jgi:hypothetical protein